MNERPSILKKIFEVRRRRVEEAKAARSPEELRSFRDIAFGIAAESAPSRFSDAVRRKDRVNIIAEFKRASPSKGIINADADPARKASEYAKAGAAAVSVLTEEDHFMGSIDDLDSVRWSVSLPILRKDFIFDPFQIYESRIIGADAVLLIAAMLDDGELAELMEIVALLALDALVEVHDKAELDRAEALGAKLIGVNNRDLNTFGVSLDHSRELIRFKPDGSLMISESGISSPDEIEELRGLGFDGFLIGEALMNTEGDRMNNILSVLTDR
ncbi:MAG: indole-3-glycerol phosphate synthase TrpC [Acidobacteriota bacterium]|nr:MAG: indole-3-glycerol phosphate synthase TrpC [Acidobacteriota bacterium]